MTDSDGHLVDLASLVSKGPLMISFNRGRGATIAGWSCMRSPAPILNRRGRRGGVDRAGTRYARLEATGLPFRVLTDLDLAYALSLGLVFWVGDKIKQTYRQFGIDLEQFQGHGGWMLPIPATLVIGTDDRVKARFVDPDFRHRMAIEDILRALA